ncbi:2-hydroxychromene-2-carboxylate isomerase [soil metagenome]
MSDPIVFYLDFISPYAYVAWNQVHAIAKKHDRTVTPIPILFAAVLDAHGQKGPAEIPAKRVYTFKDALRKAHHAGLPLVPPPSHPFNPLLALRVASLPMDPTAQRKVIDALYDATWRTGAGVENAALVENAVTQAGFDGPALVNAASEASAKDRLRDATKAAIDRGVFGVPTVAIGDELFWGVDGLAFVDAFLRGEDPVPSDLQKLQRPVSAVRPRSS